MPKRISGFVKCLVLGVLATLCLAAQSQRQPNATTTTWQPKFEFGGELVPSFVLTMNGRAGNFSTTPEQRAGMWWIGERLPLAAVSIRPANPNTKVHVTIEIDGFTDPSSLDATLSEAGAQYIVSPVLRYHYTRLEAVQQSVPATVIYTVQIDGKEPQQLTLDIRIRSINDVPLGMIRSDGYQDLSSLFAGYVNESDPFVEKVLQEALQAKVVNSSDGYQRGVDDVRQQVFALWYVLQQHGLHYSSITTPSAASPGGRVASQAVRFIDQSVQSQQANCVDGSVLFASLLYKIGIKPILVVIPGHMFVGYYLDKELKRPHFLETTMLGAGPHPKSAKESWQQFNSAVMYANQEYDQKAMPGLQQHTRGYSFIEIEKMRQAGVNAIPHCDGSCG